MSDTAKSAAVAPTPLSIEMAAVRSMARFRQDADDIVGRFKLVCPEDSRLRTAAEMRAVARSFQLAAEHINGNADTLEASYAG